MILDQSIPYRHIIMRLDPGVYRPREAALPRGYTLRSFRPGDEHGWAKIQHSVNEFPTADKALDYYRAGWLPYGPEKLAEAQYFVISPEGEAVADAMLRPREMFSELAVTRLDWVACMPEHQRQGLARGLLTHLLNLAAERWPREAVYLPTQPASYAAIRLYWELGFRVCRTSAIDEREKPDPDALEIIQAYYPDGFGAVLKNTAVE